MLVSCFVTWICYISNIHYFSIVARISADALISIAASVAITQLRTVRSTRALVVSNSRKKILLQSWIWNMQQLHVFHHHLRLLQLPPLKITSHLRKCWILRLQAPKDSHPCQDLRSSTFRRSVWKSIKYCKEPIRAACKLVKFVHSTLHLKSI